MEGIKDIPMSLKAMMLFSTVFHESTEVGELSI